VNKAALEIELQQQRDAVLRLTQIVKDQQDRIDRMTAPADLESEWEVRIAGPDDVIVFSDEVEALRRANEVNIVYLADRLKHPNDEVMCIATAHRVAAPEVKP